MNVVDHTQSQHTEVLRDSAYFVCGGSDPFLGMRLFHKPWMSTYGHHSKSNITTLLPIKVNNGGAGGCYFSSYLDTQHSITF